MIHYISKVHLVTPVFGVLQRECKLYIDIIG